MECLSFPYVHAYNFVGLHFEGLIISVLLKKWKYSNKSLSHIYCCKKLTSNPTIVC